VARKPLICFRNIIFTCTQFTSFLDTIWLQVLDKSWIKYTIFVAFWHLRRYLRISAVGSHVHFKFRCGINDRCFLDSQHLRLHPTSTTPLITNSSAQQMKAPDSISWRKFRIFPPGRTDHSLIARDWDIARLCGTGCSALSSPLLAFSDQCKIE
jgi:hypothetical protein